MENAINNECLTKRNVSLLEVLILSRLSAGVTALFKKIRGLLLSVIDFIECPSFFEGEITDTSRFTTRILLINKLNNK